jgi:hypothetical protein
MVGGSYALCSSAGTASCAFMSQSPQTLSAGATPETPGPPSPGRQRRNSWPEWALEMAPDQHFVRERATGIEPAFSAWEADVLPLYDARKVAQVAGSILAVAESSVGGPQATRPTLSSQR